MIFCNIRTDFNFIFGQFSVARKLILNGGAIRPIGLLYCLNFVKSRFTVVYILRFLQFHAVACGVLH